MLCTFVFRYAESSFFHDTAQVDEPIILLHNIVITIHDLSLIAGLVSVVSSMFCYSLPSADSSGAVVSSG